MADAYYFVSDLHIGGDEQLQACDFEEEFVEFLRTLAETDEDAELILLGDSFGLWEFTESEGLEKLDLLVEHHPELFEQLRATGEHVRITMMPGNHDAELAGYPAYVDRLAEYNVDLEPVLSLTREVGEKRIWVEHGMQRDDNNRMPDFGNPLANPLGYFVNRHITSKAGQLSERGKYNWLKDIQAVTPLEEIPYWLVSNYFYREMNPLLRYAVLPFLLLFYVSVLYLAGIVLEETGILNTTVFTDFTWLRDLGFVGDVVSWVILVNVVVIALLVVVSVPLYVFARDVHKTLERFGVLTADEAETEQDATYLTAAREVFATHPNVVLFVYGHTHRVSLTRLGERAVVNTGTWLKRLERVSARVGLLPPVYVPSYQLNYFKVEADGMDVVLDYHVVEKPNPNELSLLQRLVSGRRRSTTDVPGRTVLSDTSEAVADRPPTPDGQSS